MQSIFPRFFTNFAVPVCSEGDNLVLGAAVRLREPRIGKMARLNSTITSSWRDLTFLAVNIASKPGQRQLKDKWYCLRTIDLVYLDYRRYPRTASKYIYPYRDHWSAISRLAAEWILPDTWRASQPEIPPLSRSRNPGLLSYDWQISGTLYTHPPGVPPDTLSRLPVRCFLPGG